MANITEELNNPQWAEGIYQLETTDPVLGGPNGIANRQAKELAARTQYLKKKQEEDKPGAASTTKAGIVQLSSATDSNSEELAATPKAVKAAYDKAVESAGKGLPVGAVIGFPRAVTNQEGYLKADGSTFAQATYPDLYRVLGGNKLPKLTRSDIGMTAHFPVSDIPDGWIKYDEIAAKVTQAAYPELYRKLVVQYGSIDAVPKAEDRFIRNAAGGLTVGTQQGDAIRNIKGKTSFCGDDNGTLGIGPKDPEGVFGGEGTPNAYTADTDRRRQGYNYLTFDASRSVPVADEVRPKAIAMVLCIKAQNRLDDVVMWVKAYGKVTNAGVLDAATLAAGLQNKSDKGHTHRAAEITDLSDTIEAVVGRLFASKKSASGYLKIPGGLIIQWGNVEVDNDVFATVIFPVSFPTACLNVQVSAVWGNVAGGVNVLSAHVGKISQTGCSVTVSENGIFGRRIVNWLAIGH